jgi:hypothetical protein
MPSTASRRADCFEYLLIARKFNPSFTRDELVTNPHSELACLSRDSFDFHA